MPSKQSKPSNVPRPLSLRRISNRQFDEIDSLIRKSSVRVGECPTCEAKAEHVAEALIWPTDRTYFYDDKNNPCNCQEQETLFRHYLLARIPQEYMRLGVDTYWGDPEAMAAALAYVENWPKLRKYGLGIGFYSETQGTGKTFLAMMIARELVKQGESVHCIFFRRMVEIYDMDVKARREEEERIRDCTVLVLDEVARPVSEAQRALFAEKFEELIRHRSNYNKVTLLTTNLEPDELDTIYPRTYSLLAAKEESVHVNGSDVRKENLNDINKELALNDEIRPII
ncbi:MAG: ATP-binding protein [Thaumarchaeota archaeon]|nr:ATP-binding protein [Nitrososphaerota archaeon]